MILKKGWSKMIFWCTIARMFLKMHEIRDSCLFQSLVFQFFHVTRNRHESVPIPWTWMGTLSWRSCDLNTSTEFCVSNLSYHTFWKTDVLPLLRQRQESLSEIFVNQVFHEFREGLNRSAIILTDLVHGTQPSWLILVRALTIDTHVSVPGVCTMRWYANQIFRYWVLFW